MSFSFWGATLLSVALLLPAIGLQALQPSHSDSGTSQTQWVLVTGSSGEILRDAVVPDAEEAGDCPSVYRESECDACRKKCEKDTNCTVFLTGAAGTCDYYWYLSGFNVYWGCKCV